MAQIESWNSWGYNDDPKGEHYGFPRVLVAPRNSAIEIEVANSLPKLSRYVIKFQISEILNPQNTEMRDTTSAARINNRPKG